MCNVNACPEPTTEAPAVQDEAEKDIKKEEKKEVQAAEEKKSGGISIYIIVGVIVVVVLLAAGAFFAVGSPLQKHSNPHLDSYDLGANYEEEDMDLGGEDYDGAY